MLLESLCTPSEPRDWGHAWMVSSCPSGSRVVFGVVGEIPWRRAFSCVTVILPILRRRAALCSPCGARSWCRKRPNTNCFGAFARAKRACYVHKLGRKEGLVAIVVGASGSWSFFAWVYQVIIMHARHWSIGIPRVSAVFRCVQYEIGPVITEMRSLLRQYLTRERRL